MVGSSPQSHDVVPPLLNEHTNDALNAIADEVASHFHALFLSLNQLSPDRKTTSETVCAVVIPQYSVL